MKFKCEVKKTTKKSESVILAPNTSPILHYYIFKGYFSMLDVILFYVSKYCHLTSVFLDKAFSLFQHYFYYDKGWSPLNFSLPHEHLSVFSNVIKD